MSNQYCLSIRQPWAWLIINGFKDIENREWATNFRGPFLIHAAKTMTKNDYYACRLFLAGFDWGPNVIAQMPGPNNPLLLRGGIVGCAQLVDCVHHCSSDWFTGYYGFVIRDARPIPFVPLRGKLGFFRYVAPAPQGYALNREGNASHRAALQ